MQVAGTPKPTTPRVTRPPITLIPVAAVTADVAAAGAPAPGRGLSMVIWVALLAAAGLLLVAAVPNELGQQVPRAQRLSVIRLPLAGIAVAVAVGVGLSLLTGGA